MSARDPWPFPPLSGRVIPEHTPAPARRQVVHDASGALVGAGAVLSGSAARTREHAAAGTLVGPGAVLSGAARLRCGDKRRTSKSNETRLKDQLGHRANDWLESAYQGPKVGRDRLMQRARRLLEKAQRKAREGRKIEPEKLAKILKREAKERDEITEHRTRVFLQRKRNPGAT